MTEYRIKRIYEPIGADDGYRVLVDRIWPRGVSKEKAALDQWIREIAPTDELRHWFDHDPVRFEGFTKKYIAELDTNSAVDELRSAIAGQPIVTLLYGAHDEKHNQAVVLQRYLQN